MLWMVLATALAQSPDAAEEVAPAIPVAPVDDADSDSDSDVDATIIVYGRAAIEAAREDVVRSMEELGWTRLDRGGELVFKPPERWMGRATFTSDGRMEFASPPISFGGAGARASGPTSNGVGQPGQDCGDQRSERHDTRVSTALAPLEGETWSTTVPVTFRLYRGQTAVHAMWEEQQVLAIVDGHFTTTLGRVQSLAAIDWQREPYWLGITVQGEDDERPRLDMHAVARMERVQTSSGPCSPNTGEFDPFLQQQRPGAAEAGVGMTFGAGRAKRDEHIDAVLQATARETSHYRAVVQETVLRERASDLPDTLDALWQRGQPLYGSDTIEDLDERRRTVLELWASRANNRAGAVVCESIEGWLIENVLYSEHPITEDEYATFEAQRVHRRSLPRP